MEIDKLHGKKYLILIDREIGFYSNDQKTRIFFKIWCSILARTRMCSIIWCSSLLKLECARSSDARARSIPELFDARPPLVKVQTFDEVSHSSFPSCTFMFLPFLMKLTHQHLKKKKFIFDVLQIQKLWFVVHINKKKIWNIFHHYNGRWKCRFIFFL